MRVRVRVRVKEGQTSESAKVPAEEGRRSTQRSCRVPQGNWHEVAPCQFAPCLGQGSRAGPGALSSRRAAIAEGRAVTTDGRRHLFHLTKVPVCLGPVGAAQCLKPRECWA